MVCTSCILCSPWVVFCTWSSVSECRFCKYWCPQTSWNRHCLLVCLRPDGTFWQDLEELTWLSRFALCTALQRRLSHCSRMGALCWWGLSRGIFGVTMPSTCCQVLSVPPCKDLGRKKYLQVSQARVLPKWLGWYSQYERFCFQKNVFGHWKNWEKTTVVDVKKLTGMKMEASSGCCFCDPGKGRRCPWNDTQTVFSESPVFCF